MKYIAAILGLTIWLIITVFLVSTIIGILVVLMDEYTQIPLTLLEVFQNKNGEDEYI